MNEPLIEFIACWIYESQPSNCGRWQDAPIGVQPWYRLTAREMVRRIETGHVKFALVPLEPTDEMLSAGDSMMPQIATGQDITTGYDALKEAWPAMLAAVVSSANRVSQEALDWAASQAPAVDAYKAANPDWEKSLKPAREVIGVTLPSTDRGGG